MYNIRTYACMCTSVCVCLRVCLFISISLMTAHFGQNIEIKAAQLCLVCEVLRSVRLRGGERGLSVCVCVNCTALEKWNTCVATRNSPQKQRGRCRRRRRSRRSKACLLPLPAAIALLSQSLTLPLSLTLSLCDHGVRAFTLACDSCARSLSLSLPLTLAALLL